MTSPVRVRRQNPPTKAFDGMPIVAVFKAEEENDKFTKRETNNYFGKFESSSIRNW